MHRRRVRRGRRLSIRTSESGKAVLGQGGVNSYCRSSAPPPTRLSSARMPCPRWVLREQVVAQVQRHSIMGSKGT